MKITEILSQEKPVLSFEVFPPKKESAYETVEQAAVEIARLSPSFMSVTYGAGGGTSQYTADLAACLAKKYGVTSMAHLTCVSSTREHVMGVVERLRENGIENILALRGVSLRTVMWKRITATPVTWRQSWRPWEISASAAPAIQRAIPNRRIKQRTSGI